ncbi:MAG TPA: hypothetical protein VF331_17925 [Polyangiales bacterium]
MTKKKYNERDLKRRGWTDDQILALGAPDVFAVGPKYQGTTEDIMEPWWYADHISSIEAGEAWQKVQKQKYVEAAAKAAEEKRLAPIAPNSFGTCTELRSGAVHIPGAAAEARACALGIPYTVFVEFKNPYVARQRHRDPPVANGIVILRSDEHLMAPKLKLAD